MVEKRIEVVRPGLEARSLPLGKISGLDWYDREALDFYSSLVGKVGGLTYFVESRDNLGVAMSTFVRRWREELERSSSLKFSQVLWLIDLTASMAPVLPKLTEASASIFSELSLSPSTTVLQGLMVFRGLQDEHPVQKIFDFQEQGEHLAAVIPYLKAHGGGVRDEALDRVLESALSDFSWDINANKVAILVTNAKGDQILSSQWVRRWRSRGRHRSPLALVIFYISSSPAFY